MSASLYRHFDFEDVLLYVGASACPVSRLSQHKGRAGWYNQIAPIEVTAFPTKEAAIEAETEAIRSENPRHNIQKKRKVASPSEKAPHNWGADQPIGAEQVEHYVYRGWGLPETWKNVPVTVRRARLRAARQRIRKLSACQQQLVQLVLGLREAA